MLYRSPMFREFFIRKIRRNTYENHQGVARLELPGCFRIAGDSLCEEAPVSLGLLKYLEPQCNPMINKLLLLRGLLLGSIL